MPLARRAQSGVPSQPPMIPPTPISPPSVIQEDVAHAGCQTRPLCSQIKGLIIPGLDAYSYWFRVAGTSLAQLFACISFLFGASSAFQRETVWSDIQARDSTAGHQCNTRCSRSVAENAPRVVAVQRLLQAVRDQAASSWRRSTPHPSLASLEARGPGNFSTP